MTSFIADRRARWQAGPVPRRGAALRLLLALVVAAVVVLGAAQLVLPPLAAEDVRDRVGPYGSVESVSISAFPALTLLWHSAGSLNLRAQRIALSPARGVSLLTQASGIDRLDVTVRSLRVGPLRLRSAHVRKRGSAISAEGLAGAAELRAVLPGGVALVASEAGAIRVSVGGSLLGLGTRLAAFVRCVGGRLVLEARGLPLPRLVLFADRRLYLTAVGFSSRSSGDYRLWLTARLV
jgi:hypothetical protein